MYIVTAKEMYDIDRYAMEKMGIDGKLLMENAGRAVAEKAERHFDFSSAVFVLAGAGNNGGDGFVIARTLLDAGYDVQVAQAVPNEKIKGDSAYHKQLYVNFGGKVTQVTNEEDVSTILQGADVIIDALFGIGVKGNLRSPFYEMVEVINRLSSLVISVDMPSGLPADEGTAANMCVQADYTFVIGAPKMSCFLEHTSSFYGEWETVSIGLPRQAFDKLAGRRTWNLDAFQNTLPVRSIFDHKGDHGRGLVIGGSEEMPGSITLTVKAALKAGAGLITAGASSDVIPVIAAHCPEATYQKLPESNGFLTNEKAIQLEKQDAIAIGIGMGRQEASGALVGDILDRANVPVVIDADGLFHLKSKLPILKERENETIITPHPGEMAMLMDISVSELLQAPFHYASAFASEFGVYVLLKGRYTIITAPNGYQAVNHTGNPGLAKGGTGDVLTGVVLAQVMQRQTIFEALCNACFLHGSAADMQVETKHAYYDLMATDVIDGISNVYRIFS